MRYVIIGCGTIGMELARGWTGEGHEVVGTTTTAERLPEVAAACTEAVVLDGADAPAVSKAVKGADYTVIAVNPRLTRMRTRRERAAEYRDTLIRTVVNVASVNQRVLFLSSIAVYGAAAECDGVIDESTPVTNDLEPSSQTYASAERVVLESPAGIVLRLPWVLGHARSLDFAAMLRLAGEHSDGELGISEQALCYSIDYRDAAAAAAFVIERGLTGPFNAVPDASVPPTMGVMFRELAKDLGLSEPTFHARFHAPERPVSTARLRAAGFEFRHAG